ncbi:methyltransferase [Streptomyces sp. NPDC007205]|uniref:methyltransferase n=1 Tax=Streptomyces sp. NPDC007205 TaxID=3154316 RepID=UPI0033D673E9
MEILLGFVKAQSMKAAIELGIPEFLAEGPKTIEEVSAHCRSDQQVTARLLRCLSSVGLAAEVSRGTFAATDLTAAIQESAPGNIAAYVRFSCRLAYPAAAFLTDVVRTGDTGSSFVRAHGKSFFELLGEDAEAGEEFDAAMAASSTGFTEGFMALDWSDVAVAVDVGGGNGALLRSLLSAHGHLRGILCERPNVLAQARTRLSEGGLLDRCKLRECDFFKDDLPVGDVYCLARILHDWDDTAAAEILRRVRAAIPAHGRLLIAEQVLPEGPEPHWTKTYDLYLGLLLPGNERNRSGWEALLASTGFWLENITPAGWRCQLLTCVPQ